MADLSARKHEIIEAFLQAFRVALNFMSMYSKSHKSFLTSVDDLKHKTDILLQFVSPIDIDFAPEMLSVGGEVFEKKMLYLELAKWLHMRKIKKIHIEEGVTSAELAALLESVSFSMKELLKKGGIVHLLNSAGVVHCSAEELDYSMFLREDGEEVKDLWAYMLGKVIIGTDDSRIKEFALNFDRIICKFKIKDFLENEELVRNIKNLFTFLGKNEPPLYLRCVKALLKTVLLEKTELTQKQAESLRSFFGDFDSRELAKTFWNELAVDADFDNNSFQSFLQIFEQSKHGEIAESLHMTLQAPSDGQLDSKTVQKVQRLFSVSDNPVMASMYQRVTAVLEHTVATLQEFTFDTAVLNGNYHYILLYLLEIEKNANRLGIVSRALADAWENIMAQEGMPFMRQVLLLIEQCKREGLGTGVLDIEKRFSAFIENAAWQEAFPPELDEFVARLEESSLDAQTYMRRFFEERKVNKHVLRLFLQFFPDQLPVFNGTLAERSSDMELVGPIIEMLPDTGSSLAGDILKLLYDNANALLRIEIVHAMQRLPDVDGAFILNVLATDDIALRKEALAVAANDAMVLLQALDKLLGLPNPWGRDNAVLLENITIVEDLGAREATNHLMALSRKPFFWNSAVRQRAKKAIEAWNV